LNSSETATELLPAVWWGRLEYIAAFEKMTQAHSARVSGQCGDAVYYVEHPPIITYGRATVAGDLNAANHTIPTVSVNRGGLATYHAPGQLVAYPIIDLKNRSGAAPDIHAYLRALEQGIMDFVNSEFGLPVHRREGFTGVWTHGFVADANTRDGEAPGRKLASIGITARQWITMHGLALNINLDMAGFHQIVPCGITDASMTSIKCEFQRVAREFPAVDMENRIEMFHPYLAGALGKEGWGIDPLCR
jgi:lipoate-protein ligase B